MAAIDALYAIDRATVYHGDGLTALPELSTASVDALITTRRTPPVGGSAATESKNVHTKYVNTGSGTGQALPAFTDRDIGGARDAPRPPPSDPGTSRRSRSCTG